MTRTELERLAVLENQVDSMQRCMDNIDTKLDAISAQISKRSIEADHTSFLAKRFNSVIVFLIVVCNFSLGLFLAFTH